MGLFRNPFKKSCEDEFDETSYFNNMEKKKSLRAFSGENSTHKVMEEVFGKKEDKDHFKLYHNEYS
ncbi:hypothetical protein IPA_03090 [Ignicoccus pacificus DSM 13166]|uniref:Uncharacterized protein n=1 Tax=Ignicoccus pacificus DSM 13166 TaxID=940294 RepID=A0A977KAX0_9CREN|nr:hypothetical protein IPA_03090 [Ignicoccus pacificus DSM 13166]